MPISLSNEQKEHLAFLREKSSDDIIQMCKSAFEYLTNEQANTNNQRYEQLAKKYASNPTAVKQAIESLISLLIDATKANASESDMNFLQDVGFSEEAVDILSQFVTSKRGFIEGSIKSANIRAYRLVHLEWRLEVRVASRSLLRQSNIFVTMKFYLHTEPKNENRDLLEKSKHKILTHADERRNRKDLLVQTDLSSLVHIIHTLEDALLESKTRRIKNIVDAIH
ncbi:COMM domain-containing protein 2 [Teleopsis dalmanni]|uniref:COMM domain-containing protein 2-like n=1 Tax=Teleopsis dalmanni TaxID=139649 RepID=UPI0018CCAC6E|nr:COMM domain-containing protein 2-like [Teleopsis dalmanni]XP_037942065.1 COMM domain-containing protein 2 [Teleopsis dalmanni]